MKLKKPCDLSIPKLHLVCDENHLREFARYVYYTGAGEMVVVHPYMIAVWDMSGSPINGLGKTPLCIKASDFEKLVNAKPDVLTYDKPNHIIRGMSDSGAALVLVQPEEDPLPIPEKWSDFFTDHKSKPIPQIGLNPQLIALAGEIFGNANLDLDFNGARAGVVARPMDNQYGESRMLIMPVMLHS